MPQAQDIAQQPAAEHLSHVQIDNFARPRLVTSSSQEKFSARDNLENWFTGALATEINRSYSGTRGMASTHAVANSLGFRQESLRLEKTLKLRQKTKDLEEQLKIAVLQNQGLR